MMNIKEKNLDLGLSLSLNSPWINTTYFISPPAEEIEKEKEEEERVSSPDSTVSSVSGKRLERSGSGNTGSRTIISDEDEDDGPGGSCSRKKLRLSKEQSAVLEDCFRAHSTLNPHQKQALAAQLGLRPRQVEVWFQNRRARTKLKQTEVDCEYLKRWCERLTDENKRLQKEVAELRALKAASSTPAIPPPASMTTLAMCPSCQRVSSSSKSPTLFAANNAKATTAAATVMDTSKQAALSHYCQFFPMASGSNQNMWTSTNALHTRELF
ncbi:Homeobox-leucine zipper protein [Rhynchospora pubera]|uniref:Homeobox-leucine zipper protein n=1 Tax=Rhynchospora pubera TaxID=906938 RepID=A0AAV8E0Y4_9POAL|nr:Homeobox-leucine zipper protein [Rhynchospora pubera]